MQDQTDASWVQDSLIQESLDTLRSDFVIRDCGSSYISRSILRAEAEYNTANLGIRLEITRASIKVCHR